MQRLLHNNYNCEQATYTYDGRLVLDYLEQHKETGALPDVIFLDLDVQCFTGWEFFWTNWKRLTARQKKPSGYIS